MIEKIKKYTCGDVLEKINEIVDAVNRHEDIIRQIGEWGSSKGECLWCEKLTEVKLDDPYAEQRRWIGKLCKFRDCEECGWQYGILTDIVVGNDYPYWMGDVEWAECQPVLEDEFKNVIYKRENNE